VNRYIKQSLVFILLSLFGTTLSAKDAVFLAEKNCPANKKLTSDNPGRAFTQAGESYRFIAYNKKPATHYLIDIPAAPVTSQRWVDIDCGQLNFLDPDDVDLSIEDLSTVEKEAPVEVPLNTIENVLAASWQPTFCASARGVSKQECITQHPDRPDALQFSIHGLWPDDLDNAQIFPCYCGNGKPVSCRKKLGRKNNIDISDQLRSQLEILMPGIQSGLHLHEWSKHGTCYERYISGDDQGSDAEEYFAETVHLISQLNSSDVTKLFVSRLGMHLSLAQVKTVFDSTFGAGSGDRFFMTCTRIGGTNHIAELWIGLGGEISLQSDLGELIANAPTIDSSTKRKPCSGGVVFKVEG